MIKIDPDILKFLTPEELAELDLLLQSDTVVWRPLPGPQSMAYHSKADIIGYGGAAGGGKTDLAVGKSLTKHQTVGIFRMNGTELTGVIDRFTDLLGNRVGFNGKDNIWRLTRPDGQRVQVEFCSFPNPGDEKKYQGRPHDFLVFDEAANMREDQVRYVMGWLRTTKPNQSCQALLTFNPPTTAGGRWITRYFAPWLDKTHPNPAKPGELRWYATVGGKDLEVVSGEPFDLDEERITPQSRTFVPSRIGDNPYLLNTGYMAQLQSLPEPLRSQMLNGDFQAGIEDNPWQVIPTEWIDQAMKRWRRPEKLAPMDSIGVDVARAGKDKTLLARRHGMWFDVPMVYPGSATPDGPTVAGLVVGAMRDRCVIHIDVIGVGASPYDFLSESRLQVIGVNVSESALGLDKSGRLRFKNQRSELYWRMREALDPANNTGICLPPDSGLLADLAAPTWKLVGSTVYVSSREEIIEKIGRSPDYASAYVLALMDTPKRHIVMELGNYKGRKEYDPYQKEESSIRN